MQSPNPIFILGILCLGFVFAIPADNLYEDEQKLKGVIDGLVNSTLNSILAGLPEPIAIDALPLSFSDTLINGEANITNFKLSGLKEMVATKIDVSILSLAMNATIVIKELALNTRYYADIVLAELIPLYGSGLATVTIDAIEILLGAKVSITGGLQLSNVTVQLGLDSATFDLHGLLNNEDFSTLVNQVLTDNIAPFLNEYKEAIGNIISPIAQELINAVLAPKNTTELLI